MNASKSGRLVLPHAVSLPIEHVQICKRYVTEGEEGVVP